MSSPLDVLRYKNLADAGLKNGWIAQFRGDGYISRLIQRGTGSVHSHSGMIMVDQLGREDLLEVREFVGGRRTPLISSVLKYPGQIDIFRPSVRFPEYNPARAMEQMRYFTSVSYGYRTVFRISLRKCPFVWRFYAIDTSDNRIDPKTVRPHCSMAVAMAIHEGGVDVVPWLPAYLVTPGHITNSLFCKYHCTLIP